MAFCAVAGPAAAQDKVVATVNGKAITEADMRLAEAEIGSDLGNLPPDQRRRVLAEYLIENQLFAEAAEAEKLASGPAFDERMGYWKRRAARDAYFEKGVKGSISDAETRKFYESQVSGLKTEEGFAPATSSSTRRARQRRSSSSSVTARISPTSPRSTPRIPAPRRMAATSAISAEDRWCRSSRRPPSR